MHLLKSTSGEPDFRCLLPAACRLSIATVCCALCAGAADFDVRSYGAKGDGTEVVALFNYEADETVRVALAGQEYEVEPLGVRFVETKKGN